VLDVLRGFCLAALHLDPHAAAELVRDEENPAGVADRRSDLAHEVRVEAFPGLLGLEVRADLCCERLGRELARGAAVALELVQLGTVQVPEGVRLLEAIERFLARMAEPLVPERGAVLGGRAAESADQAAESLGVEA